MDLNIDLPHHSYTIRIQSGSLARVGTWLSELWQVRKVVVITDHQVEALYAKNLVLSLEEQGFEVAVFSFLQGEAQKSLETVSQAYDFLANFGMTRQDGILALGGGVVGDLAGFVASTYMRGIPFVQVPTSLMAQVDASVGGKTAVNTDFAKNIVGSFHQPDGVLIDPETLKTLGNRELIEGMAEVMKVAMIADQELWSLLEGLSGDVLSILRNAEAFIYRACRVKADLVMSDERDCGVRQFLNFGHTFGHALEKIAGYGHFIHGEAVAVGMVLVSRQAEARGLTETGLTERLIAMCQKFGLPTTCPDRLAHQLYQAVALDKKARGKEINLVIVPELGQARLLPVPLSQIKDYLEC